MKYSIAIMALLGSSSGVSISKHHQQRDEPKIQTPDGSRETFEQHVKQADSVVSTQKSTEGSWLKENSSNVEQAKNKAYSAKDTTWKNRDRQHKSFHPTTTDSLNQQKAEQSDSDSSSDSSSSDEDVQTMDNEAGLEVMANGSAETFPLRGNPKAITATWARGTVDMVDPDGKVADINRTMINNPDRSREAWASTRGESRQIAVQQHGSQEQWLREHSKNLAEAKKSTFDQIFKNEQLRNSGMKQFYVNPTTPNEEPTKPPGFSAALQLADDPKGPGLADQTFTRNAPIAEKVTSTQQQQEKEWLKEHQETTSKVAKATQDKKLTNNRAREGVYQNNWHRSQTKLIQLDDTEDQDDIDYIEIGTSHHAGEEEEEEAPPAEEKKEAAPAEEKKEDGEDQPVEREEARKEAADEAKKEEGDGAKKEDGDAEKKEDGDSEKKEGGEGDASKKEEAKDGEKKKEDDGNGNDEFSADTGPTDEWRSAALQTIAKQEKAEQDAVDEHANTMETLDKQTEAQQSKYYENININGRHDWGYPYAYYNYN